MTVASKIILTVEDGLSRQEMDDLQYLFADALGEFAVRRTDARTYVENRYPGADFLFNHEEKIAQVERRIALAKKLHSAALQPEYEHVLPHKPVTVYAFYQFCDEDDLGAASALLAFLPAAQFNERKGWMVSRAGHVLIVEGPDEQKAFWLASQEKWLWLEEGQSVPRSVA